MAERGDSWQDTVVYLWELMKEGYITEYEAAALGKRFRNNELG
jgi:hypothetical protein